MTLRLGIPSKGRLQEQTAEWLADAGMALSLDGGERGYRGRLAGLDCEVWLLSASEIARTVRTGELHLGVTGLDILSEQTEDFERQVGVIQPLGFGRADLVVAVPTAWLDVETADDLIAVAAEIRARHKRALLVATKYARLTAEAFARWGLSDYRLIDSPGATEAAPAAGQADIIVDITTTGATLIANGLKPLEQITLLRSQAALVASRRDAPTLWTPQARAGARSLLARLGARARAKSHLVFFAPGLKGAPHADALDLGNGRWAVPRSHALALAEQASWREGAPVTLIDARFVFVPKEETNTRLDAAIDGN